MGSQQSKPVECDDSRILLKMGTKWIDATDFIASHPGGETAILNKRNKDITVDYKFHSKHGQKMIDSMIINP